MRRFALFLLALVLLLLGTLPSNAQAVVQQAQTANAGAGTTADVVLSAETTGNMNFLTVSFCTDSTCAAAATGGNCTATDTRSNTYTVIQVNTANAGAVGCIAYAKNITGGSNTVHVTATGFAAANYLTAVVSEWTGLDPIAPLDVTAKNNGTGTAVTVSTATTTQPNELVLAFGVGLNGGEMPGAGYVQLVDGRNVYKVVSTTGIQTATFTVSSGGWWADIATFKRAAAGYGLISHVEAGSTDTSSVTTPALNVAAADLCVVAVTDEDTVNTITFSSSPSLPWITYTGLTASESGGDCCRARLYYFQGPGLATSTTFTASATGASTSYPSIAAACWAGSLTTPFDQQNHAARISGVTTIQPGSITPTQANELIVSAAFWDNLSTATVDSAMTLYQFAGDGVSSIGIGSAWKIQGLAAAINPTFTFSATGDFSAVIASFKMNAGPVTPKGKGLLTLGVGR